MDFNQKPVDLLNLMKSCKMKQEGALQFVLELPSNLARTAGILKYIRESTHHLLHIVTQSQVFSDYQIKCEYCEQNASPSLDQIWISDSTTVPTFCCEQWEALYELLLRMKNVLDGNSEDGSETEENTASDDLMYRRKKDKWSMLFMDSSKGNNSKGKFRKDKLFEVPVQETGARKSKFISFRLSCPPKGTHARFPKIRSEKKPSCVGTNLKKDEVPFSLPVCDHKPLDFGLCHHQDGRDLINKNYSDGQKFLLMLDDGSAQVFYPSGLLAIIVIAAKQHGRVCMVYDDTPDQRMRALFQSDGKGACYHTNGNIWLTINKSEGQCLNPEGARVCKWTWHKLGPTLLQPTFLPINKCIGVRVLGKEQVFVSFLAKGQQAKFNVGTWCHKGNCKETKDMKYTSRLVLSKDELTALASGIKIRLLIERLHHYMTAPSHPKLPNAALNPHLHSVAQKLLKGSKKVKMSKEDNDFLQSCLQDCL